MVHAVKPEPHHQMPRAASTSDTFWDFVSLMPSPRTCSCGCVGAARFLAAMA